MYKSIKGEQIRPKETVQFSSIKFRELNSTQEAQ